MYLLTVELNCAVYVTLPVTADTVGDQPENVYVYWAVAALVGVEPLYVGVVP